MDKKEAASETLDTEALLNMMEDLEEARKELATNEAKFRKLFENSQDAIIVADFDGKIVDVNLAAISLFGYSKKEFLFLSIEKIRPPKEQQLQKDLFKTLKKSGAVKTEVGLLKKSGQEFLADISFSLLDKLGSSMQLIIRDITEQRHIQDMIKESEEKFRLLAENSVDVVWELDKDLRFTYLSPSIKDFIGYTPKELSNQRVHKVFSGKPLLEVLQVAKKLTTMKKGYVHFQEQANHKNGTKVPIDIIAKPLFKKGKFQGLHGSARDIKEQVKAEQALKESEKRFKTLFEDSKDAIMTLEPPSWKFTSGNPACIKLFDCKDEKQFTNLEPWEVSPKTQPNGKSSNNEAKKHIMHAMKTGSSFFKWVHKRYKGKEFPTTVLLTRIDIGDGKPFLQATVRDISIQKAYETQLKNIKNQLETIFEGTPVPQLFIGKDHKILYCNKAMEKLTEVPAKKAIGTNRQWYPFYPKERKVLADFLIDNDIKGMKKVYGDTLKKSNIVKNGYVGTEFFPSIKRGLWLTYSSTVVKDSQGNILGAIETVQDITPLKKEQEKLVQEEKKFRDLIEAANEAILIFRDKKFVYVNEQTCKWIGYSQKELLGKSFISLIHPDDRSRVVGYHIKRLLGFKAPEAYRFKAVAKDGSIIHMDVKATKMIWEGKSAALTFMNNITEQVKVEEEIKEINEIVTKSGSLAFTWKNEKHWPVEMVSENVKKVLGYSTEDFLTGKIKYSKIMHPEDLDRVVKELTGAVKNKKKEFEHEPYRLKCKNGNYIWVSDWTYTVKDKGKVTHFKGIIKDITERKNYEQELERSKKRFSDYVTLAQVLMIELDKQGKVLFMNDYAKKIIGKDVTGKNWFTTCIPKKERQRVVKVHDKIIKGTFNQVFKNPVLTKKGERMVLWRNKVIKKDDKTVGTLSSGTVLD